MGMNTLLPKGPNKTRCTQSQTDKYLFLVLLLFFSSSSCRSYVILIGNNCLQCNVNKAGLAPSLKDSFEKTRKFIITRDYQPGAKFRTLSTENLHVVKSNPRLPQYSLLIVGRSNEGDGRVSTTYQTGSGCFMK